MAILFKRSNGIYYHITCISGKQIWRSTGTRSRQATEKILTSRSPKIHSHPKSITLGEFKSRFLSYAPTNFAPTTVKLYDQAIRTFERLEGDRSIKTYTIQDIEDFKVRRSAEVSPVKVN